MAIEFQEVLILESWRGAVDCVETLLSMCDKLSGVYLGVIVSCFYSFIGISGCLWVGGVWFEILMEGADGYARFSRSQDWHSIAMQYSKAVL